MGLLPPWSPTRLPVPSPPQHQLPPQTHSWCPLLVRPRSFVTCGCMLGGPALLPPELEEAGEGILVVCLVAGLSLGASCGFLWLL